MGDRLKKAKLRIRLGLYADETSQVCQWQVPEAHFLETWGDARAFDGTVTIQQPLIAAALRRALGDAVAAIVHRAARENSLRDRQELLEQPAYRRRFRSLVAEGRARWHRAQHGAAGEDGHGARRSSHARAPAPGNWAANSKSSSVPTPRFTTAASPTTAGCRNCPSPSPSSPGTTPPSSARPLRTASACRPATC